MINSHFCIKRCVFPAGAGVILGTLTDILDSVGFPRRCGGDPEICNYQ